MKTALVQASARLLLLAILLMVGGAMSASVAHDLQHAAHHTATSHSNGICAWMCATGGIAQAAWPAPLPALYEAEPLIAAPDRYPPTHIFLSLKSRAPPISLA